MKPTDKTPKNSLGKPQDYPRLLTEIKERIRSAQYEALKAVNKELVGLYWDIGRMIMERQDVEGWGKAVVERLSADLRQEFPGVKGFSVQNLWYMRQFYSEYQGSQKLQPLVGEIAWAHNLVIMSKCKDSLEREFYIRMTRKFGWSKNVLIHQIDNQSYEKSLLGQTNFDQALTPELRAQAKLAVKDEYTFDFLELGEEHSERQVRQEDENPSIGIILCKEKNRTIVEYALHDARKPIGVATYEITKTLPKALKGQLPSPKDIARLLEDL
ncbi:PDDEXK nuclease domain-containing protein [Desulfobotulus sp.]|jgi:predicted nuclease of restriction endonuclease-like (RecB) superfamily|uniref:PDDEXK nuclease domain-containing protein n=1 Tax=Desulfobotulus sp. TaxID=1940337 RepID=UPI002A35E7E8|nr:PDDEXK nuclease domain-containing protein [Desulfobotulus sp.]MDY0162884.1 PDDEXK nuclease domain-containing protein [Desulfobotulus sp.]